RQLSKGLIMSIGGINTDLKEHMQTANQISAAANGAKVTIVYNATHSPWVDVPECVAARMGYQMPPVQHLKNCWNEFIATRGPDEKIFIRCHSNGAQYVKQALESSPKSVRERIIVLAIAPAVIIPKSLCFDSFNYVSRRDFVTHLDINGKIMYGKELHILEPHVEANRFDHSSLSPTFKEIEKYHIDEYLEGCENK
ncbi:MAG: DUF687 family protein, partial [Chlamydiia bacterium]|nr:DUF687 family protein [Chlamydiia bacterium]